jgi:hypothetical protein
MVQVKTSQEDTAEIHPELRSVAFDLRVIELGVAPSSPHVSGAPIPPA